jgi:hypothetical protein
MSRVFIQERVSKDRTLEHSPRKAESKTFQEELLSSKDNDSTPTLIECKPSDKDYDYRGGVSVFTYPVSSLIIPVSSAVTSLTNASLALSASSGLGSSVSLTESFPPYVSSTTCRAIPSTKGQGTATAKKMDRRSRTASESDGQLSSSSSGSSIKLPFVETDL